MRIDNRVPFGIALLGSYKIILIISDDFIFYFLLYLATLRSPDIFAPACIPVTDEKKTAKIVKKDSSLLF